MQTRTMAEAERVLWVHLVQPQLQQGHPEQGTQGHSQVASGDVQGGDMQPLGSCVSTQPPSVTIFFLFISLLVQVDTHERRAKEQAGDCREL